MRKSILGIGEKKSLLVLAFFSSLSSAGAVLTLMSLSASFLINEPRGLATAAIQTSFYLAIATTGLMGGAVIQKFSPLSLGICGPILSAIITFGLSLFNSVPPEIGLPAIFLIFMLNGIEHPNLLRYFNLALKDEEKLVFFTFSESITSFFSVLSPALAAFLITQYGSQFCFQFDSLTYLMSCIPWIALAFRVKDPLIVQSKEINFFVGFQLIVENRKIFLLNVNRMLNNVAYVTWATLIPLILIKQDGGDRNSFTSSQALCSSLIAIGFILAGLSITTLSKNRSRMLQMIFLASFLGFGATFLLLLFQHLLPVAYFCAFFIGLGTYCFRLTGITLGSAYTPKEYLGPVIIAGDTIVRGWSFIISILVVFLFQMAQTNSMNFIFLLGLISTSLFAPFFILNITKSFVATSRQPL